MRRTASWSGINAWLVASGGIALLVFAPIAALVVAASDGSVRLWEELIAYVLPAAVRDTLLLLGGVAILTVTVGAGAAWLTTAYDFPGRKVVDWALLLPLAVPTYIIAYAYLDILHPVGPLQTALRSWLAIENPRDFRLPDIRSMWGCVTLLGFALYPYVYLATRAMFMMQSANLIDVARTLGSGRGRVFLRVAIPLARPAIAVGVTLALLEALNDIGAAEFLGVRTLTVSIYTTWVTRSDLAGAAQIAVAMLVVVLALVMIERHARRQQRYANDAQHPRPLVPHRLGGWAGALALAVTVAPITIGFVFPAAYLLDATLERLRFAGLSPAVVTETFNTIVVSAIATVSTIGAGVMVAYAARTSRRGPALAFVRMVSLGYAVPGTVLAIGLLPIVTGIEAGVDAASRRLFGFSSGLLLLGTGVALVYAYVARFLAVAAGAIEAGFSRISPSLDDAARTLGHSASGRLWRIHLPLARPALATAALLVFVDCMKELPATLLLRPLGFETLATHLYGDAVRGTYEDAAIAALLIVLAGLVPVIVLARVSRIAYLSKGQNTSVRQSAGSG
jgi:iron(III) transport system permease protein